LLVERCLHGYVGLLTKNKSALIRANKNLSQNDLDWSALRSEPLPQYDVGAEENAKGDHL